MRNLIKLSIHDFRGVNLVGKKYEKLLVIDFEGYKLSKKTRTYYWKCLCDCGKYIIVNGCCLTSKIRPTKSCGCFRDEKCSITFKIHGDSESPEYLTWLNIKGRCTYIKNKSYKDYGDRGITICNEWLNSFEQFLEDMGRKPAKEYSIERIDVNGNYCKENCKWATPKEQANNRRSNVLLTYKGITKNLEYWANYTKLPKSVLRSRYNSKWSIEKIIETPIKNRIKKL